MIVFLVVVAALVAFLATILTPLYNEIRSFVDRVPDIVQQLRDSRLVRDLDQRYDLFQKLQDQATTLPERLPTTASALLGVASRVFGAIVTTVSVLFLTLFLLLELPTIARSVLSLLHPPDAERVEAIGAEINVNIARYVTGVLTIGAIAGTVAWLTLTVLGVPFALVLALLVAVFDLIPLIGATIGLVICVLVAFTQGVAPGLVMLAVGVAYQQVENNVIQPIVMRRSVSVSPFVVLFSVLAGTTLLGVVGALLAIPFAKSSRRYARYILEPVDISQRMEYKLSRWLEANLRDARVMVPGSASFFLNAFTDNPQLGGGFDQALRKLRRNPRREEFQKSRRSSGVVLAEFDELLRGGDPRGVCGIAILHRGEERSRDFFRELIELFAAQFAGERNDDGLFGGGNDIQQTCEGRILLIGEFRLFAAGPTFFNAR